MYNESIFTEFQTKIIDLVQRSSPPGKHCARNAIENIKKAWEIRKIDPNMAAFRAITAEEEGATAIFQALKRRGYKGAEKLKIRNHVHKNAVIPFLIAVSEIFSEAIKHLKPELVIDENKKTLQTRVIVPGSYGKFHLYPIPPLNFDFKVNGMEYDFISEFKKLVILKKEKNVVDYLINVANYRNKILYAAPEGIPAVSFTDNGIIKKKEKVFVLITIFLLIDDHAEKQIFVQQALNSFLKILMKTSSDIKPDAFC